MKKEIILLLCFVFTLNIITGQAPEGVYHQIKFSPLRMVHLINPGVELSYEVCYGRLSSQLSYGRFVDLFPVNSTQSDVHGYRVNFEEKFVLKRLARRKAAFYISSEIGYNHIEMTTEGSFEYANKPEGEEMLGEFDYWGEFDLRRKAIIVDVKLGTQITYRHFVLDIGGGLGVKFQDVKHYNKRNPDDVLVWDFEDLFSHLWEEEGRYPVLNIPITLKIGYVF